MRRFVAAALMLSLLGWGLDAAAHTLEACALSGHDCGKAVRIAPCCCDGTDASAPASVPQPSARGGAIGPAVAPVTTAFLSSNELQPPTRDAAPFATDLTILLSNLRI